MIQDYIIAFVQWGFAVALIPTVLHKDNKPTFMSAIWTTFLLIVLAGALGSLSLWNGAVSSLVVSVIWATLAVQRYRINRRLGTPLVSSPFRKQKSSS